MLICDKRRPARARGYQYQAPPRGPNKDSPPGLRPAPRALLGRGLAPPDPQGCAPWRAFAHRAPAASVTQPEGFRARVRRWRGWATACGCPCPTPSPPPLPWIQFFKSKATGAWASRRLCPPEGVGPCSGGGGQTPAPPAGRCPTLGGQRGCPRPERATGRSACATRFPPAAGAPPSLRRIRGRFS